MYFRRCPSSNPFLRQLSRSLSSSATYARPTALPLNAPAPSEESEAFVSRVAAIETFFSQPRFSGLSRSYSAAAVASKQGSLPPLPLPSTLLADKLYAVFDRAAKEGQPVHTLGAIDPVQMTQMARWLEVMYVSGWAASSVLTTANNEVGPDLGWATYECPTPTCRSPFCKYTGITRTPQFRIKSTVSSVHNSFTIRNITMRD